MIIRSFSTLLERGWCREICMAGLKNRGRLSICQSASNFIGQILLEIVFKVHYDIAEIADELIYLICFSF